MSLKIEKQSFLYKISIYAIIHISSLQKHECISRYKYPPQI